LGDKSKSKGIWNNVLGKCEKKLANWKSKYLSLGGRATLSQFHKIPFVKPFSILHLYNPNGSSETALWHFCSHSI